MSKTRTALPRAARSIALRAVANRDFPVLARLRNDLNAQASLLALPRPNSARQVRAWIARRAADENGAFFVIADARDDSAIGFVQAVGIDPLHRVAEMGICILDDARGRGYGREAIALLERYLAHVFRVRKIWLRVDAGNAPAIALYHRAGFRRVGTLLKHHYTGGRYHDVMLMEKLLGKGIAAGR